MQDNQNPSLNHFILAQRLFASRQWDRGLEACRDWLGREPENVTAHLFSAQALVNLNREADAEPHLAHVLSANPNHDFAHRLMAMVQFKQRRFQAADDSIRRAISLNPFEAYHWSYLADMSYRQGDLVTAKKCAEKALEFSPRDPDILNLLVLCEPNTPEGTQGKIRRYEEALALDPENSNVLNNLGVQYLDQLKDNVKAEECFRRALFFSPGSKLVRSNLFITLKRRDWVYRVLTAPRDFLGTLAGRMGGWRKRKMGYYLLTIPLWIFFWQYFYGVLILWFLLVWPVTKFYEYLTIGDLQAQAGELGARRGGFLNYRKWPLRVRFGIFATALALFWAGMGYLLTTGFFTRSDDARDAVFGLALICVVFFYMIQRLRRQRKRGFNSTAARARARRVDELLGIEPVKRKWWQVFQRKSKMT